MSGIEPTKLLLTQPTEKELAMFRFYKENPDLACMDLLKQDLAPFQRKIIKGNLTHYYTISILSRGSGKTRMMAMIAAIECMFNPKKRIGFLAPKFATSKMAFAEFMAILDESEDLQACVKRISRQTDVYTAEFHNGAFIFALPLAADSEMSIRGTRLHTALIDEYPHVPKEILDKVITPMLATQRNPMMNVRRIQKERELIEQGLLREDERKESDRNRVCGFSSAYFQYNHMYKTICDYKELAKKQKAKTGKSDYATYIFNYHDAPEGFFDQELINHAKAVSSEITFRMEFESIFPSDSDGFFKRSLLDSCISKNADAFNLELLADEKGIYVIGLDPASEADNFGIVVVKITDNRSMKLVRCIALEKTPLPDAAEYIRLLVKQYNAHMVFMDKGGGGSAVRDLLANPDIVGNPNETILDMEDESNIGKPGKRMLKLIDFAPRWISEANYALRSSLEHKRLLFPAIYRSDVAVGNSLNETEEVTAVTEFLALIEEVQSIVMTATPSGALHFDTPKRGMKKDRYSALLLAHKCAHEYITSLYQPATLISGGVLGSRGLIEAEEAEEMDWTGDLKILAQIEQMKGSLNQPTTKGSELEV